MKKIYLLGFVVPLISLQLYAQSVKNVQATVSNNDVIISYDLTTPTKGQKFDIIIKSSKDGFSSPLTKVSGDVGSDQVAGIGKKIIWEAKKELGIYKGILSFEITAIVTYTPIQFLKPTAESKVKMGKPYTLEWRGGTSETSLKLELLKNSSQVVDIGTINNTGSYTWSVPKTMTKGENYQFKFLDPNHPNDAIISIGFTIGKKPSALVYIIPAAAVVGIGAAVLLGGGDEGGTTSPPEIQTVPELPDVIHPGGG